MRVTKKVRKCYEKTINYTTTTGCINTKINEYFGLIVVKKYFFKSTKKFKAEYVLIVRV